jgi:ribosome biogenesis GTPase
MAKRKLTQRQQERIKSIQENRRQRAQKKPVIPSGEVPDNLGPEQTGKIITHFGATLSVENMEGEIFRCTARQNLGQLVCGDKVVWQESGDHEGIVVAIHPRKSLLSKPGFNDTSKPVAANIDQIIIIAASKPVLSKYLIDRYLIIGEATGIQPIIVINKSDLLNEKETKQLLSSMQVYSDIGYTVLLTSVKLEHGLKELANQLKGKTSILVGQSGVGKSSIVKALLPGRDIRIGKLSETDQGKHTTTTSILYHLSSGGDLIDSPGVRDFGVWHIEPEKIAAGFIEFQDYLGTCKFSNCSHTSEPECALQKAVKEGKINNERLQSFLQIMESLDDNK